MNRHSVLMVMALGLAARVWAAGVPGTGSTNHFPEASHSGAPVELQLWQWGEGDARKVVSLITNDAEISFQAFTTNVMSIRFRIPVDHDTVFCRQNSSDQADQMGWGPNKVVPFDGAITGRVYRMYPENYANFPAVGSYCVQVDASKDGKSVAAVTAHFKIVDKRPVPANTSVLVGRKDAYGNLITSSKPVVLNTLNETPKLKDNDYPFEPQHAFNTVNYERFPPFQMPPRFLQIWCSRRFSEESVIGGPLNRGFNAVSAIDSAQDNLPISQRAFWHTPDLQVMLINKWYATNPVDNADLKAYADCRSAFVSHSNAYKLGWASYEAWGGGGWAPYDAGVYGWDEEQMWPTIGVKVVKEHPELVPPQLLKLKEHDPDLTNGYSLGVINNEYERWWGDFVGYVYRGARDCAAQRGRTFKIWHYGSKAPGNALFLWNDFETDPATGRPKYESFDNNLFSWFKNGKKVDFEATEYSRQIDYFHKDFYYHILFPHLASMYEKNGKGEYVLDDKGRRKIRKDVIEENVYTYPVKVGHEDYELAPIFLKAFISKGEDALYWFNGGKYYKDHGTAITKKQLVPAIRPGNQETWGETAKFGQRPVSPFMAEASVIYTYMIGIEGVYLWDAANGTGPEGGEVDKAKPTPPPGELPYITKGDLEFIIKGMHRVSQFDKLFEGTYSFIRPTKVFDTWNRDNATLIRGIINGQYLVLAMNDPYLDPGETQRVELWYDAPYEKREKAVWHDTVTLESRKNHIFQCKLPKLPKGASYDPDKLYFRYTLVDGTYTKTFTVSGNYTMPYAYDDPIAKETSPAPAK